MVKGSASSTVGVAEVQVVGVTAEVVGAGVEEVFLIAVGSESSVADCFADGALGRAFKGALGAVVGSVGWTVSTVEFVSTGVGISSWDSVRVDSGAVMVAPCEGGGGESCDSAAGVLGVDVVAAGVEAELTGFEVGGGLRRPALGAFAFTFGGLVVFLSILTIRYCRCAPQWVVRDLWRGLEKEFPLLGITGLNC